jgi:hypothetical protein
MLSVIERGPEWDRKGRSDMAEPLTSYFEQNFGFPDLEKKRAKTEKAQVGLRLPEPLRARLEKEAKESGYSLNFEIVRRLEQSIKDDDLGDTLFGDRDIFHCAYIFAGIIHALERHKGDRVGMDPSIFEMAVDQLKNFAKIVPAAGLMGIGRELGGTRTIFDIAAARALQQSDGKAAENA